MRSSPIEIKASVEDVWAILTDFSNYARWNCLNQRVETTLQLGEPVKLWVSDASITGREDVFEHRLLELGPPHHLAWGYRHGDIHTRRDQYVDQTATGCIYRTTDTFYGPLAEQMFADWEKFVRLSFDRLALSLKAYAEGQLDKS